MKKLIEFYIKPISFLTLFLFIFSCKNQDEQLKDVGFWKYSEGFNIGDIIDFNSNLNKVGNDTIYRNGVPLARFLEVENRFFSGDKVLYIQSLTSDEAGVYVSK